MRPIPNYPDYFINQAGEVFSLMSCNGKGPKRTVPRKLKPRNIGMHRQVSLTRRIDGVRSIDQLLVHRLVLEAFVGPCPPGMLCRHLNGNGHDNRLENLAWGTRVENEADKALHGTRLLGQKHPNAALTNEQVREIKDCLAHGMKGRSIAARFGISENTVSQIKRGRVYRTIV